MGVFSLKSSIRARPRGLILSRELAVEAARMRKVHREDLPI